MKRNIRQFVLGSACILISLAGFSTRPEDERSRLEAGYNEYIESGRFLDDYDHARKYLMGIVRESEAGGYWDLCVGALSMVAYVSDLNYHHDVMRDAVVKGRNIIEQHPAELDAVDPQYYIRAEMTLMIGTYYTRNFELKKAADVFHALLDKLQHTPNPDKSSVFKAYAFLADLYIDMGLNDKVDACYQLMQKSLPENDRLSAFVYMQYIASSYSRNRKYEKAKSILREATAKVPPEFSKQWRPYIITSNKLLATIFQKTGKYDSANLCLQRCMQLLPPGDPAVIDVYEMYGDGLTHEGNYTEALGYFRNIESIIRKEPHFNLSRKAQILSKMAGTYHKQGKYHEALTTVQQAFRILYKDPGYLKAVGKNPRMSVIHPDKIMLGLLMTKANALYGLADHNRQQKNPYGPALETYRLASGVIENFRHLISNDDFKEFFVMDIRDMYENAIMACYEAYRLEPNDSLISFAYYFMEKSKNQVLMDAIRQNQARKYYQIPDSLIKKEFRYKSRLVRFQNDLYALNFSNADPEKIRNCIYESAQLQNEYEGFLKTLETQFPEYYHAKYRDNIPSLQELKKYTKRKILIEYLDGENSVAFIACSRNQTLFRVFRKDREFNHTLNAFVQSLYHSNEVNWYDPANHHRFTDHSYYLYKKLLGPVLSQFSPARELILIPDGRLCFLPFEALIRSRPRTHSEASYDNLKFLIRDVTVRYEYSAGLLDFQRTRRHGPASHADVYSGFAPLYSESSDYKKVQVLGKRAGYLSNLKYNREEVESAAGIFKGRAFLGKEATREHFRNAVSSRIIHFAGHTVINDSIPELSGMFFAGGQAPDGTDEVLYLDEMFSLDMNTRLAILSGCETGIGRLLQGEGLSSIGRAFKYAGCNDLVMTLWKINDRSASFLIKKFCLNLRFGVPTASALRKAKMDCLAGLQSGRQANPLYWSAFVMIGSNEPLFPRYVIWFAIAGVAGILVLVLILLYLSKTT